MYLLFRNVSKWYVLLSLYPVWAHAQIGYKADTIPSTQAMDTFIRTELKAEVTDSLEIVILRQASRDNELLRIVDYLKPENFDLLPGVFPVDLPLSAFEVTSPFGTRRHPVTHDWRFHNGVDVKARPGMVVKATAAAIVTEVGNDPTLGIFVRLQHAFGFETIYGHLSGYCVKPGERLGRNQEIGKVGQTGLATGPHLHYIIKKNGSNLDPFAFCFLLRRRLNLYHSSKSKPNVSDKPSSEKSISSDVVSKAS